MIRELSECRITIVSTEKLAARIVDHFNHGHGKALCVLLFLERIDVDAYLWRFRREHGKREKTKRTFDFSRVN